MQFAKKFVGASAIAAALLVSASRPASANLFNDIFGLFNDGGSFWDFGNIFHSQGWDNPLADILDQSIGTNGTDIVGTDKSVFDVVYGSVGQDLGFSPGTIEAISSGDLSGILDVVMGDVLQDIGLQNIDLGTVLGRAGIPVEQRVDELLTQDTRNSDQAIFGRVPTSPFQNGDTTSSTTINVNPSLIDRVQSGAVLTESITAVSLSPEGQEVTASRRAGAETALESSQQMGGQATALAETQLEVAEDAAEDVEAQTSTQDVLKVALTSSLMLDAQKIQMDAYNAEQAALSLQVDAARLFTEIEGRDVNSAVAMGIQTMNEQLVRNYQQNLASQAAGRSEIGKGLRLLGALR